MKKNLYFILIALLLVSAFSIYSWWQCKEKEKRMLVEMYTKFELNRWELESMGETFEHLLQNNASDEIIQLYARNYRDNVFVAKNTFIILASKEEKFWKLYVAMGDLFDFLNNVSKRKDVEENLETLKQFDSLFKELNKYQNPFDIPDELAEGMLKVSKQLEW